MENQLLLKRDTVDSLSTTVKTGLSKMTPDQQQHFEEEFLRKKKSLGLAIVLLLIVPISFAYYIYLGKIGLAFLFFFTGGGLGIWWLISIFTASGSIKDYNADLSNTVFRDLKMMTN